VTFWWKLLARRTSSESLRRRVLSELQQSLAIASDPRELQGLACRRVRELIGEISVQFCEYQPVTGAIVVTSSEGRDVIRKDAFAIRPDGNLVQWLRVNEDVLGIPDPRGAHEFLTAEELDQLTRGEVRACVPLLSFNRLVGLLLLVSPQPRAFDASDRALLMESGRLIGLAFEALSRRQSELARAESAHQAQRLAIAGQLAAAMAHEVRNPLTAIRSTMQFVATSPRPWADKLELIQSVLADVDRIEDTITGVLSLSRTHELARTPTDLVTILVEALRLVTPYGEARGVQFEAKLERSPLPILGDDRELRRVFVNVLFNSCQAMAHGGRVGVRAALRSRPSPANDHLDFAMVEIADDGVGMAPEVLARVFDPFFTTKNNGTGLGLPICLEIVHHHDGEIHIASEPGRGTVVTVLMPLRTL
jgi:signal transduction histidine kinase